jgi:bilirubin oxidase
LLRLDRIISNPTTGKDIWYYEVEIKPFTHQVYPNLKAANLVGYDGISPGPTFIIPRGTESIVRFINNARIENSVHLHGSYSRAPFDGWAEDITRPGEYKDYYYPNQQSARLLWYHDHAMHYVSFSIFI